MSFTQLYLVLENKDLKMRLGFTHLYLVLEKKD